MEMFYSKHRRLQVDLPGKKESDKRIIVRFSPHGPIGVFSTSDASIATKLRNHPKFDKSTTGGFWKSKPAKLSASVKTLRKGPRGSITPDPIETHDKIPGLDS